MAKHTPGPWSVFEQWGAKAGEPEELCFHAIEDGGGNIVSSTWAGPNEANARLIAAAPELLEALQDALGQIDQDTHRNTWEKCQAAIAKATGDA